MTIVPRTKPARNGQNEPLIDPEIISTGLQAKLLVRVVTDLTRRILEKGAIGPVLGLTDEEKPRLFLSFAGVLVALPPNDRQIELGFFPEANGPLRQSRGYLSGQRHG